MTPEEADRARQRAKEWREKNLDIALEKSRAYHKENRDKLKIYHAEWREKNRENLRAKNRSNKSRLMKCSLYRLKSTVSCLIRNSIKGRGYTKRSKVIDILGCTWEEFVVHIESQFVPGMTWENRNLWHIDHIVPLSTAKTEDDIIALNHVSNLRPLWATENLSKGGKNLFLI